MCWSPCRPAGQPVSESQRDSLWSSTSCSATDFHPWCFTLCHGASREAVINGMMSYDSKNLANAFSLLGLPYTEMVHPDCSSSSSSSSSSCSLLLYYFNFKTAHVCFLLYHYWIMRMWLHVKLKRLNLPFLPILFVSSYFLSWLFLFWDYEVIIVVVAAAPVLYCYIASMLLLSVGIKLRNGNCLLILVYSFCLLSEFWAN